MSEVLLDSQEAIARVMNKRALYVKLLGKFIDSERNTPAKLQDALSSGDLETAKRLAHTTKGAAANLGAKALAAEAMLLESAIKDNGDTKAALDKFEATLGQTLSAMAEFMAE